jgi:hypothetical protein
MVSNRVNGMLNDMVNHRTQNDGMFNLTGIGKGGCS